MSVLIRIPSALRKFTKGLDVVTVEAATVGEAMEALESRHPGVRQHVLDRTSVRRFVNLYVRGEDIRFLQGLDTALETGDVIAIVAAISGG